MTTRHHWFGAYKEWMDEPYLDEDVLLGYWLLAGYREHAHQDASRYRRDMEEALKEAEEAVKAEAVERALADGLDEDATADAGVDAMDAWYSRGEDEDVADAVSLDELEVLRNHMEEWLEDEEKYGRDYDPEDIDVTEKREWLESVSERLARRKR